MVGVTWPQAAAYCNWLSGLKGIDASEFCFDVEWKGKSPVRATHKPNYRQLAGYRLPDEVEWGVRLPSWRKIDVQHW